MSRFLIALIAVLALAGALLWFTGSTWTTRGSRAPSPAAPSVPVEHAPPVALEPTGAAENGADEPSSARSAVPAVEIETPAAEPGTRVKPVLARGESIAGVVRELDGSPAEAELELVALGPTVRRSPSTKAITGESDARGAFAILGLSADSYRVTARARDGDGIAEIDGVRAGTKDLVLTLSGGLSLTGRVVDERGDGVPEFSLEGERVASNGGSSQTDLHESFRDTDGSFVVDGLVPGTWELHATGGEHAPSGSLRVNLPARAPIEIVLPREAVVSGRVLDPRGAPVAGASVKTGSPDNFYLSWAGGNPTNEQGAFEIRALPPGPVALQASGSGFAPSERLTLEMTAGETVAGIVLRLSPGATITGEVIGADGRAQAGIFVTLLSPKFAHTSVTDAEGRFQVDGVPPGEISLWAETLEGVELEETVLVGEGENVHVRLVAQSGFVRMHGRVRAGGEPFAGGHLSANRVLEKGANAGSASGDIDEDGAYELTLPEAGRYRVTVGGGEPVLYWEVTVDVPSVESFGFDVSIPLGRISGRVTDAAGRAVSGLVVYADPEARKGEAHGNAQERTDTEGRYEVLVPAGAYAVTAGGWRQELREGDPTYAASRVSGLLVTENSRLHDVDLRLEAGGILEGIVRNADGSPAGRAILMCQEENGMLGATDEDGSFRILGVRAGKHLVCARSRTGITRAPVPVEIVAGETRHIELELAAK